jgi:hypothetical protein
MGIFEQAVARRLSWTIASAALVLTVAAAHAQQGPADATLKLSGGSVAAGVGFSWGSGTLTYQGKEYKVTVKGLSVGGVGISSVEASGNVYNLRSSHDFDGNYTLLSSGVTAGAGAGLIAMSNPNGVTIELVSRTQGIQLSLASGGVAMEIEK